MNLKLSFIILLSTSCFIQAAEVSHLISLTVVDVGGNVTINCNAPEKDLKVLHWFKQPLGHMVETVASLVFGKMKKGDKFKGSRFKVTTLESLHSLTISNVSKEDEATYLCHIGTMYSQKFVNGSFLAVNDHKQQKSTFMKQRLKTELVQLGDLMTLQCSLLSHERENPVQCPAVFWFRAESEGFDPGIVYGNRNISDQDEERSCSYSLSVRDPSDAGTYYCAVVTCGKILFGEGIPVETRSGPDPLVVALGLLAFCVVVIVLLIFYIKQMKVCKCHKGGTNVPDHLGEDESSVEQSKNLDGEVTNLIYATVQTRAKRGNKNKKLPQECIYSSVQSDHKHQLSLYEQN